MGRGTPLRDEPQCECGHAISMHGSSLGKWTCLQCECADFIELPCDPLFDVGDL